MQRKPESLTLKDILKGEVHLPSNLSLFFKYLIAGQIIEDGNKQ